MININVDIFKKICPKPEVGCGGNHQGAKACPPTSWVQRQQDQPWHCQVQDLLQEKKGNFNGFWSIN